MKFFSRSLRHESISHIETALYGDAYFISCVLVHLSFTGNLPKILSISVVIFWSAVFSNFSGLSRQEFESSLHNIKVRVKCF